MWALRSSTTFTEEFMDCKNIIPGRFRVESGDVFRHSQHISLCGLHQVVRGMDISQIPEETFHFILGPSGLQACRS